jgi:uncharacterized glyoxalase superfamily protein PhnB
MFAGMHYRDARAALGWLERTLGFRNTLEVPGAAGTVQHAEMRFGDGTIMLGSGPRDPQLWGDNVQSVCVHVSDPDAHHARAKAAGAHIIQAPNDTPYGARGYYARDLDGFLWGFSTYMPAE